MKIHGIEVTIEPVDFQEEACRLFSQLSDAAQASVLTIMDAMIANDREAVRREVNALCEEVRI